MCTVLKYLQFKTKKSLSDLAVANQLYKSINEYEIIL